MPPRGLTVETKVVFRWLVTYPPSMHQKLTNYSYTRKEAEAKFGPGWCEPDLTTREVVPVRSQEQRPEGKMWRNWRSDGRPDPKA